MDEATRARIAALATDVPRLWADPQMQQRDRKQVVRLLVEDATALKSDSCISLQVRFKGGATKTLTLPLPQPSWRLRQTSRLVVSEIDRLLDDHTCGEIAAVLNERGFTSGTGRPFHADRVQYLCKAYGLKPRFQRLREAGLLTLEEIAVSLGRSPQTIKLWRNQGRLPVAATKLDDEGQYMYEAPAEMLCDGWRKGGAG